MIISSLKRKTITVILIKEKFSARIINTQLLLIAIVLYGKYII
jgi:hypothetical protein